MRERKTAPAQKDLSACPCFICVAGAAMDAEALSPAVQLRLIAWAERARESVRIRHHEKGRSLLMPDSPNRAVWDFINLMLLSWTTFEIPVSMLFTEQEDSDGLSCDWTAFMLINLIVDTLFLVDVCISFNTAYYDEHAILVDSRRRIALHYMSSWFVLDVGTSIPLDQIICSLGFSEFINSEIVRSIKIVRLLKMARILKFMRILKKWELASGSKSVRTMSRMGKFVALMIFVTHMAGCLWMIPVLQGGCAPNSDAFRAGGCTNWLNAYTPELMQPGASWSSKYLAAMYFAVVTLSTVGYGDVTPTNDMERVFAAVLALAGAVIFAYCIGSISTLANQENITEAEIDVSLRSLHDFLQHRNVPRDTQQHVKQHLLFTSQTAPHLIHNCLGLLPRRLRYRIIDDCLADHLMQCKLFKAMDVECRSFIAQYLHPLYLPENTYLFRALEIGMEMYFITEGEVAVMNVQGTRTLTRLRAGAFVGEISLCPDLISYRTSSVCATMDSHVFELRRDDLETHIKPHFPDVYEAIKEVANVRFRWLDTEPIMQAMSARCALRCRALHEEAKTYEEQRIAILRKQILENGIQSVGMDHAALKELLNPITRGNEGDGKTLKATLKLNAVLKGASFVSAGEAVVEADEVDEETSGKVSIDSAHVAEAPLSTKTTEARDLPVRGPSQSPASPKHPSRPPAGTLVSSTR